tara:strand:- start:585 stop:1631 length:1047 start_codon:yes stop_codon:yes gene_type:complete
MEKKKSLDRSKRSAMTIAQILAKEGLSAAIPGGNLMFEAGRTLFDHANQYIKDRNEERLVRFHSVLLDSEGEPKEKEEILYGEFDPDDYHSLLASCIQDIEDKKTDLYANLLKRFIINSVPERERQLFIQGAKALSMDDVRFMREIYIKNKFDLMSPGGTAQQTKQLLETNDPILQILLSRFEYLGFLEAQQKKLSKLGEKFLELGSAHYELTPDSIGRKQWRGIMINILCFEIGNYDHARFYNRLEKVFWDNQIKSQIHIIDSTRNLSFIFWSGGVLLVGDRLIEGQYLTALQKYSAKLPLVRFNVTTKGAGQTLEGVNFLQVYTAVDCPRGEETQYVEKMFNEQFA